MFRGLHRKVAELSHGNGPRFKVQPATASRVGVSTKSPQTQTKPGA